MSDTFDLILAGYPALEQAQKDFDVLVGLVKEKQVKSDGMILVTRDEAGEVHVTDTGSHLGRKGAGWGGGVGVLVGLAAPPHARRGRRRRRGRRHRRQVRQAQGGHGPREPAWATSSSPAPPRSSPCSTTRTAWPSSGHCRGAGEVGRRDGQEGRQRRSRTRSPRPMGKFDPGPHRTADPRPHLRRRGRADARRLGPRLDRSSRARRRPRARRTCCSSSSTTRASARPTPSAARSARRTSRACSRWASPTTAST